MGRINEAIVISLYPFDLQILSDNRFPTLLDRARGDRIRFSG
jgi:hypothetical protein